jgi:hypothetical protein
MINTNISLIDRITQTVILLVPFPEQLANAILVLTCTCNVSIMPGNSHPQRQAWLYEQDTEPIEEDTSLIPIIQLSSLNQSQEMLILIFKNCSHLS